MAANTFGHTVCKFYMQYTNEDVHSFSVSELCEYTAS